MLAKAQLESRLLLCINATQRVSLRLWRRDSQSLTNPGVRLVARHTGSSYVLGLSWFQRSDGDADAGKS
jgi:hypothetical protein